MYRHCIYCSAALGSNESVEAFPVGKTVAVDAAKGRLWAVCPKCARWNLAPIEERWEAVEAAERQFVDGRLRVQRENIGVAKLADGTRLVRIGSAVPGEIAAWRYGPEMRKRRYEAFLSIGACLAAQFVVPWALPVALPAVALWSVGNTWTELFVRNRRPVHRLAGGADPASGRVIRRPHLRGAHLAPGDDGEPRVVLPAAPGSNGRVELLVTGSDASRLLQRSMPLVNAAGARQAQLDAAIGRIAASGSAAGLMQELAMEHLQLGVWKPASGPRTSRWMTNTEALALEMALHEEQERRALEGELALLESAWREAEQIAAIADRLAAADVGIAAE